MGGWMWPAVANDQEAHMGEWEFIILMVWLNPATSRTDRRRSASWLPDLEDGFGWYSDSLT
jgi:hypothetical protein